MSLTLALLLGILAIVLGFISGLFWLAIFYRMDKYQPEPKTLVAFVFFLGCLSVIPTIIFETIFDTLIHPLGDTSLLGSFIAQFAGVGPIEEGSKMLMMLAIYWNKEFNEPIDGMVYSTSVALGFATVENTLYMLGSGMIAGLFGLVWTFFLRFFLSTLGHIFFSAMWGYQLGMRKMKLRKGLLFGLLIAAFLHGLYNFILTHFLYFGILIIPLMITMWLMMRGRMKLALRLSPHRRGEYPIVRCTSCDRIVQYISSGICIVCGAGFADKETLKCGCPNCKTIVEVDDVKCPNPRCGMMLIPIIPPTDEKLEEMRELDVSREYPLVRCPYCNELTQFPGKPLCVVCGNQYGISDELECYCPRCMSVVRIDSDECPNQKCGMKLLPVTTGEEPEIVLEPFEEERDRRPSTLSGIKSIGGVGGYSPHSSDIISEFTLSEVKRITPVSDGDDGWSNPPEGR